VPQKPQRPFVPHRTPTTPRPAITTSEFRLSPPFVPGSGRDTGGPLPQSDAAIIAGSAPVVEASLRSIDDFLDTSPTQVAAYVPDTSEDPYGAEFDDEPDELPPVEHFIDELPAVERFAPGGEGHGNGAAGSGSAEAGGAESGPEPSEAGWLETDWQHYDWRAAAALGDAPNDEASSAWATTDWGGTAPKTGDLRKTAAHAIATALDEIARRIREGDLAVPAGPMTDPATVAATLAALLGVKR
jgi:hypothetical protein